MQGDRPLYRLSDRQPDPAPGRLYKVTLVLEFTPFHLLAGFLA